MSRGPKNMLALAVLALTFERPMHPYEMAATLKHRHKHESIKLRYGTLYTVIELLVSGGLIAPQSTSRDGKRPERTVYRLTEPGRRRLQDWMRELMAEPAKEFPQFEAALSLLPVLPPDEAVDLLRDRASRLKHEITSTRTHLAFLSSQSFTDIAGSDDPVPPSLLGERFPAIFLVETEFRLAMLQAELDFTEMLVRRVTEEGWGPVAIWRDIQLAAERRYQETHAGARDQDVAASCRGDVTRATSRTP